MDIFIAGRMGGPEMAGDVHSSIILFRKSMEQQFANLRIQGVDAIDLQIFLNGSVTRYFPKGGVRKVVFNKKKKEIVVDICIAEGEASDRSSLQQILAARLFELAEQIAVVTKKERLEFDVADFRKYLSAALGCL